MYTVQTFLSGLYAVDCTSVIAPVVFCSAT